MGPFLRQGLKTAPDDFPPPPPRCPSPSGELRLRTGRLSRARIASQVSDGNGLHDLRPIGQRRRRRCGSRVRRDRADRGARLDVAARFRALPARPGARRSRGRGQRRSSHAARSRVEDRRRDLGGVHADRGAPDRVVGSPRRGARSSGRGSARGCRGDLARRNPPRSRSKDGDEDRRCRGRRGWVCEGVCARSRDRDAS